MNKTVIIISFAVLLALAGCKASTSGKFESTLIQGVKKNVTVGGKEWKNPVPDAPEMIQEGQEHFGHHCQVCHGLDGQNTGVPFADKVSPKVPDMTSKDVQDYTDGQLKWIIQNGIQPSGMPAWNGILEEDEMWKIVRYLRHLPPKGSLGVPEVYKEGAEEHNQIKSGAPTVVQDESAPHTHTHQHSHSH